MEYRVVRALPLFRTPDPRDPDPSKRVRMDDIVDEVVIPGFSSADWVHVETADGDVGFLPRMYLAPAEASPLIEDDFFLQCRIAALSPASRTDHHYLYALAFGESKVQNKPADPASGSVGPFQYTTQRWLALAGPTGKESDWGEQNFP